MSSNTKGRTILIEVTKKEILKGGNVAEMITSALRSKGYRFAAVSNGQIEIDTKAGVTWTGHLPSNVTAKIEQSSRAVARPKTMKPFGFAVTIVRGFATAGLGSALATAA